MSVFARSDVASITLAQTGHTHARPLEGKGKTAEPVKIWELDCDVCAPVLLAEFPDQWAALKSRIPLTPDEKIVKEEREAEGKIAMEIAAQGLGKQLAQVVAAGHTGVE